MALSNSAFWFAFIFYIILLFAFIWILARDTRYLIAKRNWCSDSSRNMIIVVIVAVLLSMLLGYIFYLLDSKYNRVCLGDTWHHSCV